MEPYAPYPLNVFRDWLHRRRWWIRLVLALVLVPWFGHFAYTRMTTFPPGEIHLLVTEEFMLTRPPAEVDRSDEMAAAIKRLPAFPMMSVPTSAPSGEKWVRWENRGSALGIIPAGPTRGHRAARGLAPIQFDPIEACSGPWMSWRRLQQRELVKYVDTPEVAEALEEIGRLSSEPFCLLSSHFAGTPFVPSEIRQTCKLLVGRAHYFMAGEGKFDRAFGDLNTAIQMATEIENDGSLIRLLVGNACRSLAVYELIHLASEFEVSPAEAQTAIRWLETHPYEYRNAWHSVISGERKWVAAVLDSFYTLDDEDNGWLVLCSERPDTLNEWLMPTGNLCSPVFIDRKTAESRLDWYWARLEQAIALPYREACTDMKATKEAAASAWPSAQIASTVMPSMWRAFELAIRTQAFDRGAIVALALSAYKYDHGRYPEELTELVPDYLSEIPVDPFTGRPLCYRLSDIDGYVLYSAGDDGVDDGGVLRDERGELLENLWQGPDLILTIPRGEPCEELVLVPARGEDAQ